MTKFDKQYKDLFFMDGMGLNFGLPVN
ncbi:MAG: hypothetical protein H6Q13_3364, partial [Bacteroidetes bacterium]|nr:hypothetical protein [Bacteroidota bacterium]